MKKFFSNYNNLFERLVSSFSFNKRNHNKKICWVINLGDNYLEAAVIRLEHLKPAAVIKSYYQNITPGYLGIAEFLKKISSYKRLAPDLVILGIEETETKTITNKTSLIRELFEKPIDEPEIQNAIYKLERRIFEQKRGEISADLNTKEIDLKIASALITGSLVNDHYVLNPMGFKGRTMGFIISNTFTNNALLNFLNYHFKKNRIDDYKIYWLEKNAALAFNLSNHLKREAIFLKISEEKTILGVSLLNYFQGTNSFLWGANRIKKKIADLLKIDYRTASLIEERYNNRELSPRMQKNIKEAIAPLLKMLLCGIEMSLKNLLKSDCIKLPNEFVVIGNYLYPELKEIIRGHKWPAELGIANKKIIINHFPLFDATLKTLSVDLNNLIMYAAYLFNFNKKISNAINQNLKRIIKWF